MRIFITNGPLRYYHVTTFYQPDWSALNLLQLAAMVDSSKHQIRVLDNWHFFFKSEEIIKTVREFKPQLVGISNNADVDTAAILGIAKKIKSLNPDIKIVGGGEAATFKYEQLLKNGFDIVVLGEGELTFKELVEALDCGREDLSGIKGLAYQKHGQVITTGPRPFVEDLDTLPFPARQYERRLKSVFFPGRYSAEIETARGCPYGCAYCSLTAFWKGTLRKKSNLRIMQELREIRYRFGAQQVYFIDDSFGLQVAEYTELFKMMIAEKLDIKWYTQIRPDTVANNPEMIRLAAESGLFSVLVGFESYKDEDFSRMGRISSSGGINARASAVLRKNGIVIFGVHMLNIPGQGIRDFQSTYAQGRRYSDIFRLSVFSPIPGTPMFERLKSEGSLRRHAEIDYPYEYYYEEGTKTAAKIKFLYFWYQARYHLSPFFMARTIFSRRRLQRVMRIRSYVAAFRYVLYVFLRLIGIKII